MLKVSTLNKKSLDRSHPLRKELREKIFDFEELLMQNENVLIGDNQVCPLKHSFTDGIYVREIRIPAGTYLTGKIHKHKHPNFLMSGIVEVITEGRGPELLEGPLSMISEDGTKRMLHCLTDTWWITVHSNPSNTEDLEKLENIVIAKDYEEYEKFRKLQENPIIRFLRKFKLKLSLR